MTRRISQTELYMRRLRRVPVGKTLALANADGHYNHLALWRHAARKLGQSVSIKTTPDGVRIYRLK